MPKGLSFVHRDWELACDNTRTCRAAGYHSDADELAVSLLLTRKAGPGQGVSGQLMIGQYGDNEALSHLPKVFKLLVQINAQPAGPALVIHQDKLVVDLSPAHVAALLAALPRTGSRITFTADAPQAPSWHLSDQGAAAVLLKMDEAQGRVGTRGALIKKGPQNESAVLPALPVPVLTAAVVTPALLGDEKRLLALARSDALHKALLTTTDEDKNFCPLLVPEQVLTLHRLSATKLLASSPCWNGAYNAGQGYWVINSTVPYQPELVTSSGSEYGSGNIHAAQKGRGLGDCWSIDRWTWSGKRFVHSESSTSGMCKLMAPGGAWSLPTIVMTYAKCLHRQP